jgi:D-arabinose 1-dehydrogenase-like Zn-dependent alcohol dehydrogenase
MLDLCARHRIAPEVERLPLTRANDAIARLRTGSPRYRIVLDNDLGS